MAGFAPDVKTSRQKPVLKKEAPCLHTRSCCRAAKENWIGNNIWAMLSPVAQAAGKTLRRNWSPLPAKGKGFRRGGTTKENPAFSRDSLRCAIIPFPITRRSNGDCQLGSSPGSRSSLLRAFPRKTPQWHHADSLAVTVAGPLRHWPDSLLSLATPNPIDMKFLWSYELHVLW